MKISFTKHAGILVTLILFLLLVMQPVSAQVVPLMYLYFNWTPDEQLTSFDEDGSTVIEADEERYVSSQIYIDGNVQFWAIDVLCRVGSGLELEMVDITFPQGTWGVSGTEYLSTPGSSNVASRYNLSPGGGILAFTITRVGASTTPVGVNGVDYTLPIANVRFKVRNRIADAYVPTVCTSVRFLDRNGRLTMLGRQGTFTHLFVRVGYTLRGTALRQGSIYHSNIRVTCTNLARAAIDATYAANPPFTYTLVNGAFTFGGAIYTTQPTHLRDYGLYKCVYNSDWNRSEGEDGTDDQFLETVSYINLTTPKYQLMPVTIRPGDFDGSNTIALADLNVITGAYNTVTAAIFDDGDANGDRWINQGDLALVAGNVDLSDDNANPLSAEHALYSLGTDYNSLYLFPNSRVYMGTPESGALARRNIYSITRDFWATLSPDGSEYAYISVNRINNQHALYIGNTVNGIGRPFRLPLRFQYPESLAPSWSPDGSLIAWVCSRNIVGDAGEPLQGYQLNQGALCYANRGDLIANTVTIVDDSIDSIFPPAWLSYPYQDGLGFAIIYSDGGQLKYYDLTSNSYGIVSDLPAGSDMPVIINHWSGDSYLFFRYDNAGTYELRVAKLELATTYIVNADGLTFSGATPFLGVGTSGAPDALYMVVDDTTNVEYYDVSQFMDIMLYTDRTGYNTTNVNFAVAPDISPDIFAHFWTAEANPHFLDGSVGNPTQDSYFGTGEWDGNPLTPTFLHAHRVTFDWVP